MLSVYQTSESDEFDIMERYINERHDGSIEFSGYVVYTHTHARTHAHLGAVFSVIRSLVYCELSELIVSCHERIVFTL